MSICAFCVYCLPTCYVFLHLSCDLFSIFCTTAVKIICMRIIYFFFLIPFMKELFDFKLLSLNVRGVRAATKRKALFTWLNERRYDIIFLQETYSTVDVEDIWRKQWRGKLFFAHGSNHSCGVMILVRSDLDFNPRTISCDDEGRSIIIEAEVQGSPFLFVNIYAPNKVQDQCRFFDKLNKNIEDRVVNEELRIILGGDFNVTLHSDLDCSVVDLLEKIL